MECIDKINERDANALIDEFLYKAKKQGSTSSTLYEDFSALKVTDGTLSYKQEIIDRILLPEQSNRCCYCMETLGNHTFATIEHIIPQCVDNEAGIEDYFGGRAESLNRSNICLTKTYCNGVWPNQGPDDRKPYPHQVSYHNFAAVCPKCNNSRGNNKIEPLFLYKGIHDEVRYDIYSGEVFWGKDPFYNSLAFSDPTIMELPTVDNIGLNDDALKIIRIICLYIKRNNKDVNIESKEGREQLLYELLGELCANVDNLTDFNITLFCEMSIEINWQKIKRFDYFYK